MSLVGQLMVDGHNVRYFSIIVLTTFEKQNACTVWSNWRTLASRRASGVSKRPFALVGSKRSSVIRNRDWRIEVSIGVSLHPSVPRSTLWRVEVFTRDSKGPLESCSVHWYLEALVCDSKRSLVRRVQCLFVIRQKNYGRINSFTGGSLRLFFEVVLGGDQCIRIALYTTQHDTGSNTQQRC